ncbi:DUF4080 domain-containing protein [Ruminococcus sp. OA3]|uniref:B12-binding domain-containing radical SAM protein n=1 Tax=Ruminococcus sp. OA3 TaxID=2914164 RepID=UPI001F058D70|nr:B12-binding domain-containing radical SAM protein [Ruminococcus sp. OA3]MCH1984388.1 DUF4080 domain-containing protein [Ruminococcus sp. OA3]
MKILLAAVNAKYIHSNLALYSLYRYTKKYRNHVMMLEFTINQRTEDVMQSIYRQHPDVLCFSCYIWNISIIRELAAELHKVLPDMKIWLGGPEVSYDAVRELTRMPYAAGVMRGEGEETFLQLVSHYVDGTAPLDEIAGITYRNQKGDTVENPGRRLLDMGDIPFPYDKLSEFAHRIIYYETSRGCPFSCSYCLSSVDKKLRFRPFSLVREELAFFLENRVKQVKLVDRTFNCRKDHARAIWRYLLENDNGVTNFHFEIAADLLEEEDFEILSGMRPGLIQLEIGVQSTNPDTLREIKRTMDFEKVCTAVKTVQKFHNIHQHLDLIAGLPYEGYGSFRKSFNDVFALHPEQLQLGFLKVLKGSYMWEQAGMYGCVWREHEPYEVLFTDWISYEELLELKRVEEMVEVYYNSGQFAYTMDFLARQLGTPIDCFEALGRFYEEHGYLGISHSRARRYEILLEFIQEVCPGEIPRYKNLLTFDYYLRENAKSRPVWSPKPSVSQMEMKNVYGNLYDGILSHYRGFDHRQIQRMTHVEAFDCGIVLFDYERRNPMTNDASWHLIRSKVTDDKEDKRDIKASG